MKKIIYLVVILLTTSITQAQEFKIILFGDSLMAGYGLEETYHLDRLLQQDLAALNISNQVVNASVSGDTSNGGLNRLAWSLQDSYDLFILGLAFLNKTTDRHSPLTSLLHVQVVRLAPQLRRMERCARRIDHRSTRRFSRNHFCLQWPPAHWT